ncbi:MAG: hypothetical protein ACWGSD_05995 [Thermodesulfobacteriota bacterium]
MIQQAIRPPEVMRSVYGPEPRKQRAADLPGMAALKVRDLFPDIVQEIYLHGGDLSAIRKATQATLSGVNMEMIRPDQTVDILSSEHGFSILGGEAYVEMLRAIQDVVRERTGADVRLKVAAYIGHKETAEVIEHFRLKDKFDKIRSFGPWDKGVPIETEIGTLYGVARAYEADWFIHAYYDDPREMYFHRYVHRPLKAFVMSYARYETRAAYHFSFGTRSGQFLMRAIFDSPFVRERHAFSCIMRSSPAGIIGVDADNDLYRIDLRIKKHHLKDFGKMHQLLAGLDECIAVWDGGRWGYYVHAGGVCFGVFMNAEYDPFDLSEPFCFSAFDLLAQNPFGESDTIFEPHHSIKAAVVNQAWPGIIITDLPKMVPTVVVGRDQAEMYLKDSTNPSFMDYAVTAETLDGAMDFARRVSGTDKVLVFDGSFGHLTLTPSLADDLIAMAPEVNRRVEDRLLPMWLKQRGIDPEGK